MALSSTLNRSHRSTHAWFCHIIYWTPEKYWFFDSFPNVGTFLTQYHEVHPRGAWLAQWVRCMTLELRVINSSPTLRVKIIQKIFLKKEHFIIIKFTKELGILGSHQARGGKYKFSKFLVFHFKAQFLSLTTNAVHCFPWSNNPALFTFKKICQTPKFWITTVCQPSLQVKMMLPPKWIKTVHSPSQRDPQRNGYLKNEI